MIIHDVVQGSDEWHALRAKHPFSSSNAAAMLGLCKNKTRNNLLSEIAAGISEEISSFTQKIFDDGHNVEALARPIAEARIGQELFPCTATDEGGYLSSFDGVTMMEDTCWEHKQWNEELAKAVRDDAIPDTHWPQLEHQLLVSGADKTLFTCSDGTEEKMEDTWYESVPARRQMLIDGWDQFEKDLESYEHKERAPEPTGTAPEALPVLHIEVKGMVTASNLAEFKSNALTVIDSINTDLQTDTDFADADKTTKWLKGVEEKLEHAKEQALGQTADIDALFKTIDSIKEEARAKRLDLGKLVKTRKDSIKSDLIGYGRSLFAEHLNLINDTLGSYNLPVISVDFTQAIKGKRTIESQQNAIDTEIARAKIEANKTADLMRLNIQLLADDAADYQFLFRDAADLVMKDSGDLINLIKTRISEHERVEELRLEEERRRIQAEEEAKARRNAEAAASAERQRRQAATPPPAKQEMPVQELKPIDHAAVQIPTSQDHINWLVKYLNYEDFPAKNVEALCVIAGLFNDSEESEAEIFKFSNYLHQKYSGITAV